MIFGCSTAVVVFSLVSLAFLIIATITAPATSALGLAQAEDLRYGVFGYCNMDTGSCVSGSPWYDVSSLTELTDWKMDDSARDTLVKILIVTPIAAGLTLISLLFNLFAHFTVFGGSTAFYIIGFVFTLLAFFAAGITTIVTFLLFYPHVSWPAWCLIPAAVLNLLSVPLVFFALRTSPSSTDTSDEEDIEEKNLTDLTDGDQFGANTSESFRLNTYGQIPPTNYGSSSTDKFTAPNSVLKVVTDDSSSSGDNFEKVSMNDYSKSNQMKNNENYRGYPQTGSGSGSNTQTTYSEGTPNLVSSQNYSKGGAIRSEALSVQPQSAKPEFGGYSAPPSNSYYPSSQYSTVGANGRQGMLKPPTGSSGAQGSTPYPSSQPVSKFARPPNSNSNNGYTTTNSDSNVIANSNPGSFSDGMDEINDNDSDFTSVSQRAANPRYYRGLQPGPSLFPNNQQQVQRQQPIPEQQVAFSTNTQSGYYNQAPPSSHYSGFSPQPMPQATFNNSYNQQPAQAPTPAAPVKDTSDYLLAANPDFRVAGPASLKPQSGKKPVGPATTGGYRPAYKRLNGGNKGLPAASLSADSPYNFR